MAEEQVNVTCPEIPACPECPETNIEIPQPLEVLVYMSDLDRKIYLAGCALTGVINNKTNFELGNYPYDLDASICANWADAVLAACGAGGSSQGGSGSNNNNNGSGGNSGGNLSCGASASGSGSSCGGSCSANPNGGTPPYSFEWSSGETTKTIDNKCSGTYTVTCRDSQGAVATASVTLT